MRRTLKEGKSACKRFFIVAAKEKCNVVSAEHVRIASTEII